MAIADKAKTGGKALLFVVLALAYWGLTSFLFLMAFVLLPGGDGIAVGSGFAGNLWEAMKQAAANGPLPAYWRWWLLLVGVVMSFMTMNPKKPDPFAQEQGP